MESRIQNGFLRAIIFMPLWLITMGIVVTIGSIIVMTISGVDMADQAAVEALFDVSFDSPVMLTLTAFKVLGSFCALWLATKFIDRKPLMSIGLSVKDKANEMLVGLGFALAFIGGLFLLLWLLGAITITGYVGFKPGVFFVSMMLFLAAFDEELIFRGYILNSMMDSSSRWVALAGSSALFALMHAGNPSVWSNWVPMTELFAAGFILGISYTFTKNLWFPTFFHFGWNFFQGLFGFEISGINVNSWKMISHENTGNVPDIISGGAFGIEGSVITLSCTIICTYFIYKYYNELDK
ncbi:MAG: type II CAAX endopeptidase family protein [Candidatus Marinimicrobia bacterium]|nr:type II CAAX endopeptidase family protein [Candidatus Neomarinimicrobiota bacterium]MDA1363908.1 type II CAAX endopeptidase family protein [Candidatus Neomarinimicrobiota bacterium]